MNKNRLALHSAAILVIVLFAFLALSSMATPPGKITVDPNLSKEKASVVIFKESLYKGIQRYRYSGRMVSKKPI